jgi:hypothetical protein
MNVFSHVLTRVPPAPVVPRNEIDAMYHQMRNRGQFYVGQFGSHAISIETWRDREYARCGHNG